MLAWKVEDSAESARSETDLQSFPKVQIDVCLSHSCRLSQRIVFPIRHFGNRRQARG
jgi:hypothetical protein